MWLGTLFESYEHVIAMSDGRVVRARSVMAFPEERLWSKEHVLGVKAAPWQSTTTLAKNARGLPRATDEPETEGTAEATPATRGLQSRREMLKKFGFTEGCRKCRMMRICDDF